MKKEAVVRDVFIIKTSLFLWGKIYGKNSKKMNSII
ncbi:hypothetical protein CACET_c11620 [Clostridium aceticum]|uniref:Uncharacterized protein n=1 Tax=Clostridium aceticum TaxID=84022 RepID=A0A0G3W9Q4_9CLOT|nr:hypothetical protein CACET_c11620 [Clostridium aceticum]